MNELPFLSSFQYKCKGVQGDGEKSTNTFENAIPNKKVII